MTSKFLSVVFATVDYYHYFMQNLLISVIFHVPNFYLSDSFFVANKQMDFMHPPYWVSFQFQKSTKAKCTCFPQNLSLYKYSLVFHKFLRSPRCCY